MKSDIFPHQPGHYKFFYKTVSKSEFLSNPVFVNDSKNISWEICSFSEESDNHTLTWIALDPFVPIDLTKEGNNCNQNAVVIPEVIRDQIEIPDKFVSQGLKRMNRLLCSARNDFLCPRRNIVMSYSDPEYDGYCLITKSKASRTELDHSNTIALFFDKGKNTISMSETDKGRPSTSFATHVKFHQLNKKPDILFHSHSLPSRFSDHLDRPPFSFVGDSKTFEFGEFLFLNFEEHPVITRLIEGIWCSGTNDYIMNKIREYEIGIVTRLAKL